VLYYVAVDLSSIDRLGVGSTLELTCMCVCVCVCTWKRFTAVLITYTYKRLAPLRLHTRVYTIILSASSFSRFSVSSLFHIGIPLSHSDQSVRSYIICVCIHVLYTHYFIGMLNVGRRKSVGTGLWADSRRLFNLPVLIEYSIIM